jgi:cytochrome c oxidase assembly protein subunit 15
MTRSTCNWTHLVACLLVAVTALLLSFGALVTTYEAAMAVPDWPGTYGHNMFLFPLAEWLYGPWDLFLEHGHRLLGAIVGMITLALAGLVWWRGGTPAVQALACAAVLLVVAQGALGGARVLLDDRTVAKVHACTGPLFFAVAVALAVLTRGRQTGGTVRPASSTVPSGPWTAVAMVVVTYLQLVAGAQLRHVDVTLPPAAFRGLVTLHVAGAVAVLALAIALRATSAGALRWSTALLACVCAQWALGLGTWAVSWGLPTGMIAETWRPATPLVARSGWGAAVVTGHVVLGMLILGMSVVVAIGAGALERVAILGRRDDPARRGRFA